MQTCFAAEDLELFLGQGAQASEFSRYAKVATLLMPLRIAAVGDYGQ